MDEVSVLHRASGEGDDLLGIAYTDEKERFQVWGASGALAGAGGLMLIPGIGPVLVAGPSSTPSSAPLPPPLTLALRRMDIPEEKIELLHQAIMDGKTVVLVNVGNEDPQALRARLEMKGADPLLVMSLIHIKNMEFGDRNCPNMEAGIPE